MSDLTKAIDTWDEWKGYVWMTIPSKASLAIITGMEAARLVANPTVRVFIRKHPEDGLPYIDEVEPRSAATLEAPDYSGWYVRVAAALTPGDTEQ